MSVAPLRKHPRLAVATALLVAVVSLAAWQRTSAVGQESETAPNPAALEHANMLSEAFNHAAEVAMPSVVTIYSKAKSQAVSNPSRAPGQNPFKGTPFEEFFEGRDLEQFGQQMPREGMGSGVIIDRSGIVLTNNHVVEGADEVTVHLADGRDFEAENIKTDKQTDLAVLQIKGAGTLPAATLGDSDKLKIGDWVMAIGNPFQLEQTVSAGIISGKGRDLPSRTRPVRTQFLQTDAAINPGNSGGPLVDLHGHVIGINTAIATNTGTYSGIGFAVPVNVAKWVTDQLINKGKVERAYLGVGIKPITPEMAQAFGTRPGAGALVTQVHANAGRSSGLRRR
jgi:serine protease Do